MKKTLLICLLAFVAVAFSNDAIAQDEFKGLDKSPADIVLLRADRQTPPLAKVIYGRPQKNGRSMFGEGSELAPAGQMWRTGANETTEITFYQDATFAGKKVAAGTYAFYTIPGSDKWTVILNSKLNTWGHYQYDASKDVAKGEVSSRKKSGAEVEAFTIKFTELADNASTLQLAWGSTIVDISVKF